VMPICRKHSNRRQSIARDPNFEYVCAVQEALGRRAKQTGLDSLSQPERNVMLASWAQGIIGNGVFQYFYEKTSIAAQVADASEALGFDEAATACRQSLLAFPEGRPPEDDEQRITWMDQNEASVTQLFDELDRAIWKLEDQGLDRRIVAYIREHRPHFQAIDGLERVYDRNPKSEPAAPPEPAARRSKRGLRLKRWPRL
jgi:hypothetical protein